MQQEQTTNVAVAANFAEPAKEIARLFQQTTGNAAILSFGSTGQLFTQIIQGAPFELFLAADQETPRKAVAEGLGREASLITYAIGRLVLYSPALDLSKGDQVLYQGHFDKLAIANPSTAPYGAAAVQVIKALKLEQQLQAKIVQGNNVTQAFQFVQTGNAELGFVALSQIAGRNPQSTWIVPDSLYSPIRQDAVLLNRGLANPAAQAFMMFLQSREAQQVIEKYGYAHAR